MGGRFNEVTINLFNVSHDKQQLVARGKAFRSAPQAGPEPHRHLQLGQARGPRGVGDVYDQNKIYDRTSLTPATWSDKRFSWSW